MSIYVLFVRGEIYETSFSEWEVRDTVYKMELPDDCEWSIERYEPTGTLLSNPT